MAVTQISDAVIPAVYNSYGVIDSPERTAFMESGIVVRSPLLDQKADTGGTEIQLPSWLDLDATREPNMSNDDPADLAAPAKLGSALQKARVGYFNQGFSTADLVMELAGSDPMQRIRNRFGSYWLKQWQRRLIASAVGVLADNVANDGGDMLASASGGYSRAAFTSAVFTMGDAFGALSAIGVHSFTYKQMVDNDDITFIPDSEGKLRIPQFMGLTVIIDDSLPLTGTTTLTATSVLFGRGAFGYGEGSPHMPTEIERTPRAGNGGGVETLWERKTYILHPAGFDFNGADITNRANTNGRVGANTGLDELTPLLADLRKAANWDRKVPRKNVPMAFLSTATTL